MWLKLPNGRDELVVNEDHVKRLLNEGAVEIPDPRIPLEDVAEPVEEQPEEVETAVTEESEQTDVSSAGIDGGPDSASTSNDRGSSRRKSKLSGQ
jgi:hypothetical protein